MDQKVIFRLAIVLGDSTASNFNTNLFKIIKLILFDNYGEKLTIGEIIKALKENYTLEFSFNEIENILKKKKEIIIFEENDHTCNKYTINPEEYEKMKNMEYANIDEYISLFLDSREEQYEFSQLKELIYKFLYLTFNEDKNTLLELMNLAELKKTANISGGKFDPDEARMINDFLNWDYKPKNEFVLNLIASCFDYCMLTVKKNTGSYSNIFNGKVFYLDSNIIFRLAGFNNEERKNVMNAFIEKCKDSGIKICYTNLTEAELLNTISYHVKCLNKMLGSNKPLSVKAMRTMGSKYANLDFYEQYSTWCEKKENYAGDFEGFKQYLNKEIKKILRKFKKIVIVKDYCAEKKYRFEELTAEFAEYKANNYRNTYIGAIKTDINNYLFMIEQNNKGQSSNFMDTNNYFITADHCLTDWALGKRPATVPIFVLPSVWYSVLLKYKGRTEDDYKAFCQFLNIRIAPEKDRLKEVKEKIFPYIMKLNEAKEIKEEIIYDIEDKLNKLEISSEKIDAEKMVQESHETISERRFRELKAKHDEEINGYKKELEKVNSSLSEKGDFSGGQEDVIEKMANRLVTRHRVITNIVLTVGMIFVISAVIIIIVCSLSRKENGLIKWLNDNQGVLTTILFLLGFCGLGFKILVPQIGLFSTDKEMIKEKLRQKYM